MRVVVCLSLIGVCVQLYLINPSLRPCPSFLLCPRQTDPINDLQTFTKVVTILDKHELDIAKVFVRNVESASKTRVCVKTVVLSLNEF